MEEVKGLTKFSIVAKLSGGNGDIAWQHTQLFRQGKSAEEFPFVINIKF
jgi:peptide-N4-(N-acetyl-beta-glucosaminyl)asparagine amidase